MLWYKAWLETRWRFLIGVVVLMASACVVVLTYPEVLKLMPLVPKDVGGVLGRRIAEAAELARDYRGYVWSQGFAQNLANTWILFAVILGTGGLPSPGAEGGALFTLSLPVTRTRLLGVRAATGLAELVVLALAPSLVLWALSPAIGQTYSVADALIHGSCLFIAGTVFFSLAVLMSAIFNDVWRPLLIVLGVAMLLAVGEQISSQWWRYGLFRVMSAETYFRTGTLPVFGLFASAALAMTMLYGATVIVNRRDF
jgi:hypothetical protein